MPPRRRRRRPGAVYSPDMLDPEQTIEAPVGAPLGGADATVPAEPGRFAGYELLSELGRGGLGVVYRARSTTTGQVVAIKVPAAGAWVGERVLERFAREARIQAEVDDPGVVRVLEVGQAVDGAPWYAMELVDGPSLAGRLDEGPLDSVEAAALVHAVARTLGRMHKRGLVHRDVKPGNILLPTGGGPMLADFGLVLDQDETLRLTQTQRVLGTPRYMAPEQLACAVLEWPRVDIYALGVVLLDAVGARLVRGSGGDLDRDSSGDIDGGLRAIADRATRLAPGERYPSVSAMADDLERWRARKPLRWRWRALDRFRRHRVALFVGAGVLLGALSVYGVSQSLSFRSQQQAEERANANWVVASNEIAALRDAGEDEAADARFEEFVGASLHHHTTASARAWLERGEELAQAGDHWRAAQCFGSSFVGTERPPIRGAAFEGLLRAFRASSAWDRADRLLASLSGLSPALSGAVTPQLRARNELAFADIQQAGAFLEPAQAAMLEPFQRVTSLEPTLRPHGRFLRAGDPDGDGRDVVFAHDSGSTTLAAGDRAGLPSDCDAPVFYDGTLRCGDTLYRLGAGEPEPLIELGERPIVRPTVAGGRVFMGVDERRLVEVRDGQLVSAHPGTNALDSYILDLVAVDLTGDGVDELVVAIGPPLGFLVRVFDVSSGDLVPLTELRPGYVQTLAAMQTEAGPALMAFTADVHPSREIFGDDDPASVAPELVVMRMEGGRLVQTQSFELDVPVAVAMAADLDGDGRDELIAGTQDLGTFLFQQTPAGSLRAPLRLGGYTATALVEVDGDPEPELALFGFDSTWLAGVGTETLPPLPRVATEPSSDPQRLLQSLGLFEAAARELELQTTDTAEDRADHLLRASALWARAGDRSRSIRAAVAAAKATPQDPEVLDQATTLTKDAVGLVEAARLAERLEVVSPGRQAPRLRWLRALTTPSLAVDLRHPLDPSWQVPSGLAVRQNLSRGTLEVRGVSDNGVLARLPLVRDGELIWARADIEWSRAELGANLAVSLRPVGEDRTHWPELELRSYGGGGFHRRLFFTNSFCEIIEVAGPEVTLRRELTMWVDLDARRVHASVPGCYWDQDLPDAAQLEQWELVVEAVDTGGRATGVLAEASIHSLELGGVQLDSMGDPADAGRPVHPWAEWWSGEHVAHPEVDVADPGLISLVRLDTNTGERLLAALGEDQYAAVLGGAWELAALEGRGTDARIRDALVSLTHVDGMEPRTRVSVLTSRGQALWLDGETERARADLEQAVALASQAGLESWRAGHRASALLAEISLALGEDTQALRHAQAAVAFAPEPGLGRLLLQRRPRLASQAGARGWEELLPDEE
jgi:hypothetical protein